VFEYEALRRRVLGEEDATYGGCGWALLIRKGMAAWMDAWSTTLNASAGKARTEAVESVGFLPEIQKELVMVMAGMALHHGKE